MDFTRRQMLKRVSLGAGAAVLSPLVQQLAAQAAGAPVQAKRFVFVVKCSGIIPGAIVPKGLAGELTKQGEAGGASDNFRAAEKLQPAKRLIDHALADQELEDSMQPLDPFRKRLTILQGLSGQMCTGGHSSWYGALGCYKTNSTTHNPGDPIAATIDGQLAALTPGVFRHIGYSHWNTVMGGHMADSVVYPGTSAAGRNKPLPFQGDPVQGYSDLFGAVTEGAAKARFDLRDSVLDFVNDDLKRLNSQLSAPEREKLGHHVEALESLQRRRKLLAKMGPDLAKRAPKVDQRYQSLREVDRISAYFDLTAAALISGLTNVVTIRPDGLGMMYEGLGLSEKNVHGIGHGGHCNGKSPAEARAVIRKFHFEQIARLAAELEKIPEGDGSMLDNTLIVYLSDSGDEHHASLKEWPMVLVGGLGERWKAGGRYVQFPGKGEAGHRTIANVWLTLLHALGHPQETFGQLDGYIPADDQKGPLGELWG